MAEDDGLSIDYKDKFYYKCFPKDDADTLVASSGTVDSIGVTANYDIITAGSGEDGDSTTKEKSAVTLGAGALLAIAALY